jgi:hypothetical protein
MIQLEEELLEARGKQRKEMGKNREMPCQLSQQFTEV